MNATISPTPHSVVDTRLDGPAALMLAEQVLATPRGLVSAFKVQKVTHEVTGRHPTGFSYRNYIASPVMRLRMNDGYVVAQDNGQGGTRVAFHEGKRWQKIFGIMVVAAVALFVAFLFLADHLVYQSQSAQPYTPGQAYRNAQDNTSTLIIFIAIGVVAFGMMAWQGWEQFTLPKKLAQQFAAYANGGGQPGLAQPQAAFPPQPQPNAWPQPPSAAAPPPMAPPMAAPATAAPAGIADRLRQLAELRDAGAITPDMFERSKAAILSEVS